ncbi:hypothetical protein Tco_0135310 [Tanacetum coccineum]
MEEVRADYVSNTTTPKFNNNAKFKLGDEFMKILCDNAFNGINEDDIVNHTAKVLAILEINGKKIRKYYPLSRTSTMVIDDEADGPDYLYFINFLNAKFKNHRRIDGKTKNALWEFWIKGGDDEVLNDDIISSDDEREESGNTNHPNNNADKIFKAYLDAHEENSIWTIKKGGDKYRPKAHEFNVDKSNDISVCNNALHLFNEENERLNEGVCKSKKFEVIRYSLGPREEYIAISTCEYDTWKRTEGIVSSVYHEIFRKKNQGWLVKCTK